MRGSIIKRGNSYTVRVYLGRGPDGKRKYDNRTAKSKKEAEQLVAKIVRDHDLGIAVAPSKRTLSEYIEEWLTTTKKTSVRPGTFEDYRYLVDKYIKPALGHYRLMQLTPPIIQKLYASLQPALSSRTVRYLHSVLHGALEQAVKWQLLAHNPAKAVVLPRRERKEMSSLTAEQSRQLLSAAEGDRFEALWYLLLTGGLRPGEALALTWTDLVENQVTIARSLTRRTTGEWDFHEPKTNRARRKVTLPESTVRKLQAHRKRQLQDQLKAGPNWTDSGLIFCTHQGGPLEWRVISRRHYPALLKKANVPRLRPYDLRHSSATLLLSAGENVKVVSERLGHYSAALTLDTYAHVLPDMGARAAERFEVLLAGANSKAV